MDKMKLTSWRNGISKNFGGHGLKLSIKDRDRYISKALKHIHLILELPDGAVRNTKVNIDKPSFWSETCREMISVDIGHWMHEIGAAPWPKGSPSQFSAHFSKPDKLLVSFKNVRN
jgi:hypothetical protein